MINHNDSYFSRMRSSLGDKERLLRFVPDNAESILDVGGGDGALAKVIADKHANAKVMLLDASAESVRRARSFNVYAAHGYADEIPHRYNANSLNVIIANSVIHEIFSYGNPSQGLLPGKISNVTRFLSDSYAALRPGGRLIIRDGFMPKSESTILKWNGHDWRNSIQRFIDESPFYEGRAQGRDRRIQLTVSSDFILGNLRDIWEYVLTVNWGENSWEREINEYYGVFNHRRMTMLTDPIGFNTLHLEAYVQEGYRESLSGVELYSLTDKLRRLSLPFTNAVWVFEKPLWA